MEPILIAKDSAFTLLFLFMMTYSVWKIWISKRNIFHAVCITIMIFSFFACVIYTSIDVGLLLIKFSSLHFILEKNTFFEIIKLIQKMLYYQQIPFLYVINFPLVAISIIPKINLKNVKNLEKIVLFGYIFFGNICILIFCCAIWEVAIAFYDFSQWQEGIQSRCMVLLYSFLAFTVIAREKLEDFFKK